MKTFLYIASAGVVAGLLLGGVYLYRRYRMSPPSARYTALIEWFRDPASHPEWAVQAGGRCGQAPFQFPTTGYIGFIRGDSFRIGHHHSGLDIFGGEAPGETPVQAVYSGYLTRNTDWISTVIIRIPVDPLLPGRQIWTYYTHMADAQGNSLVDAAFPPGTQEVYVAAGTRLGTQGNYSGEPDNPVGVHLHFSIVKDNGQGKFMDERLLADTLDPSPYFNLPLDADQNKDVIPVCPD